MLKLPWKYCECGCHGWDLNIGGNYFWLHWNTKDKWTLCKDGHGFTLGTEVGVYKTDRGAEGAVRRALKKAKKELEAVV
jgi:hypothetical protein